MANVTRGGGRVDLRGDEGGSEYETNNYAQALLAEARVFHHVHTVCMVHAHQSYIRGCNDDSPNKPLL